MPTDQSRMSGDAEGNNPEGRNLQMSATATGQAAATSISKIGDQY